MLDEPLECEAGEGEGEGEEAVSPCAVRLLARSLTHPGVMKFPFVHSLFARVANGDITCSLTYFWMQDAHSLCLSYVGTTGDSTLVLHPPSISH